METLTLRVSPSHSTGGPVVKRTPGNRTDLRGNVRRGSGFQFLMTVGAPGTLMYPRHVGIPLPSSMTVLTGATSGPLYRKYRAPLNAVCNNINHVYTTSVVSRSTMRVTLTPVFPSCRHDFRGPLSQTYLWRSTEVSTSRPRPVRLRDVKISRTRSPFRCVLTPTTTTESEEPWWRSWW